MLLGQRHMSDVGWPMRSPGDVIQACGDVAGASPNVQPWCESDDANRMNAR